MNPSNPRPQRRIAADANGPRSTYDDIEVGRTLGSLEWNPDKEALTTQCHLDQDFDPWFSVDSPYGGPIAPPQMQYRPPRWLLSRSYNIRGVFYRWEMENIRPIRLGVALTLTGRIAEKYLRNDREFVVYEVEAHDPDANLVFRTRRTHVLDIAGTESVREGMGVDSGVKAERI